MPASTQSTWLSCHSVTPSTACPLGSPIDEVYASTVNEKAKQAAAASIRVSRRSVDTA